MNAAASLARIEPADWQGAAGERWATHVDHFEGMLTDIGAALLAHASFEPGEKVVEIGCGGGGFTRLVAAKASPGGSALGLDISPALVALATERARAAGVKNIAFKEADAQAMMPTAAPFDRLVSRFGVMFFENPPAAMVNLRAMLKPGGRLDFAVWGPPAGNPWAGTVMEAARAHLGIAPPDPRAPGPFAFADADYLRSLLEGAGFLDIRFTPWSGTVRIGQPGASAEDVAWILMTTGSLAESLREAGKGVCMAVMRELVRLLGPYVGEAGAVLPASVHLVTARG